MAGETLRRLAQSGRPVCAKATGTPHVSSPIRTLTVGPGISPGQSSPRGKESRALPPVGNFTPPREHLARIVSFTLRSCQERASRSPVVQQLHEHVVGRVGVSEGAMFAH